MASTIRSEDFMRLIWKYRLASQMTYEEAEKKLIAHIDKARAERDRRIVAATVDTCIKCVPGGHLCDPQYVADEIRAITHESVLADIDKKQEIAA